MALALNLLFDRTTAMAVEGLWQELADAGISSDMLGLGYAPHVTLLITDDERHVDDLAPVLDELARLAPSAVTIGEVSAFAGTEVVYLACDGDLAPLHRAAADYLPNENIRPYYRPGRWTPHMTLQTLGDADRAKTLARAKWMPRRGVATRLELATFLPVRVCAGVDLPGVRS